MYVFLFHWSALARSAAPVKSRPPTSIMQNFGKCFIEIKPPRIQLFADWGPTSNRPIMNDLRTPSVFALTCSRKRKLGKNCAGQRQTRGIALEKVVGYNPF